MSSAGAVGGWHASRCRGRSSWCRKSRPTRPGRCSNGSCAAEGLEGSDTAASGRGGLTLGGVLEELLQQGAGRVGVFDQEVVAKPGQFLKAAVAQGAGNQQQLDPVELRAGCAAQQQGWARNLRG